MKSLAVSLAGVLTLALTGPARVQAQQSRPDVYHVHFTKAAPGQADALGKALMEPDPTSSMPTHFLVLRHQEGDDWDYCVIQHIGKQATVTPTITPPNPGTSLRSWHTDTFINGPSWADFTREMGIGSGSESAKAIYVVGAHRAVAGHREQLEKVLSAPPAPDSKIQTGNVLMQHLEGADFNFLTLTRYNSWQDLGADRAAASAGAGSGWNEIRQHSAMHHDTIADRIYPK